jgi:hypothetical protein
MPVEKNKSNNDEFMTAIQNLLVKCAEQIVNNGVAFTIMLLFCALLGWHNLEQKKEFRESIAEVKVSAVELLTELKTCNTEREALKVRVGVIEERISTIGTRKGR